ARLLELPAHDRVVEGVRADGEALLHERPGCGERLLVVGVERARVADHLELDEVGAERLAGETRRAARVVRGRAARGVRQESVLALQALEDLGARLIAELDAADRDRDELAARRREGAVHEVERGELPRAEEDPRLEDV